MTDGRGHIGSSDAIGLIREVQRLGVDTARAVVARFADMAREAGRSTRDPAAAGGGIVEALNAVVEAAGAVAGAAANTSMQLAGLGNERVEEIHVRASPGSSVEAAIWLHNPTPDTLVDPSVRTTGLIGPAHTVESSAVMIRGLDAPLPPGTSRELTLTVSVPSSTPPGRYRGLIVVPVVDASIVISLTVAAPR